MCVVNPTGELEGRACPDDAIDTLTEAFESDPLYRWLFDDPTIRRQALRENFAVVTDAGSANGHIEMAPTRDAAAIWTEPGRALFDDASMLLTVLSKWTSPRRLAAASDALAACSRYQPVGAEVLQLIGVRPSIAGSGIGSTLLRRRLVEIDRLGRPAYLESSNPRNRTFYARHGFRPVAEVRLGDDGPMITCMFRPPSGGTNPLRPFAGRTERTGDTVP